MSVTTTTVFIDRDAFLARARGKLDAWNKMVDEAHAMIAADPSPAPDVIGSLESLRHKRDSVLNKLELLTSESRVGWFSAESGLRVAWSELTQAWNVAARQLERDYDTARLGQARPDRQQGE